MLPPNAAALSMRIAKRIARSGVCSRREAERWIEMGRVTLNGKVITSPAINVTQQDIIHVDNKPLSPIQRTRVIIANKLDGELVTTSDSQRICTLLLFELRSSHHLWSIEKNGTRMSHHASRIASDHLCCCRDSWIFTQKGCCCWRMTEIMRDIWSIRLMPFLGDIGRKCTGGGMTPESWPWVTATLLMERGTRGASSSVI